MSEVDEGDYRRIFARFATGVTVATTTLDGRDYAMTANAVCSVSLDPVLVLLSVEQEARFHDAVLEAGTWGLSILAADQRPVAEWLASHGRPLYGQLDRVPHRRGPLGVPLLEGSLATLELRTAQTHPAGDHTLVVGHVESVHGSEHPGEALLYYRGRFGVLG